VRSFHRGPNLPLAGGGCLRLLPYWYTEMGIRHARKENRPVMIYVHPWEVDAQQPRNPGIVECSNAGNER
jgi:hypothetical protein